MLACSHSWQGCIFIFCVCAKSLRAAFYPRQHELTPGQGAGDWRSFCGFSVPGGDKHEINPSSLRRRQCTRSPCVLFPVLCFSRARLLLTRLTEHKGIDSQQPSALFCSISKMLLDPKSLVPTYPLMECVFLWKLLLWEGAQGCAVAGTGCGHAAGTVVHPKAPKLPLGSMTWVITRW